MKNILIELLLLKGQMQIVICNVKRELAPKQVHLTERERARERASMCTQCIIVFVYVFQWEKHIYYLQ